MEILLQKRKWKCCGPRKKTEAAFRISHSKKPRATRRAAGQFAKRQSRLIIFSFASPTQIFRRARSSSPATRAQATSPATRCGNHVVNSSWPPNDIFAMKNHSHTSRKGDRFTDEH